MPAPRVLLLSTFPVEAPQHGGQRRVRAIADGYRRQGWEVRQIGAYPADWYRSDPGTSPHFEFPESFVLHLAQSGLRADLHAHHYFDRANRERLIRRIEDFRAQVIQFEQPWLFPALREYLGSTRREFRVVYSAHNVECDLLRAILEQERHPRAEALSREAAELERELVSVADLTICVTEADATLFESLGARGVLIARNGATRRPRTGTMPTRAAGVAGCAYAFVTGSAHPPNSLGFLDVLGADFAFVPPDARLVIAGGMVRLLDASSAFQQNRSMVDQRSVRVAGPEEADLDDLLNHASVILLPITQGGGSNIKTAEALLSDRPIIGTSTAFRGFEAYRDAPGVSIEDDPRRFRILVRQALTNRSGFTQVRRNADELLWENCVREIPSRVAALADTRAMASLKSGTTDVKLPPPDYESLLQEFYEQMLNAGDCCVDVGAHTGRHTIPIARRIGPQGEVHAFEPLPHAAARLRDRAAALDTASCGTVTIRQAALSCHSGRSAFIAVHEAPEYSGLRTRHYDLPVTTERIEVEVRRLDDFAESIRDIRYLKIDVEGGELDVLRGARSILQRDQPLISFEFGDNSIIEYPHDSRDMYEFLVERDYLVVAITGEALDLADFMECSRRQHVWDYIACPRSRQQVIAGWLASVRRARDRMIA